VLDEDFVSGLRDYNRRKKSPSERSLIGSPLRGWGPFTYDREEQLSLRGEDIAPPPRDST